MLTQDQTTPEQWAAFVALFVRQKTESKNPALTLDAFAQTARMDTIMDCVMVPCFGMWLGIEKDGYTHS